MIEYWNINEMCILSILTLEINLRQGGMESSRVIKTFRPGEPNEDLRKEASKLQKNLESLYFDVKNVFLSKFNTFSLFFLDFEFKKLKKCSVERPEDHPNRIYNDFQLQKKTVPPKDLKLIEELLLSLNKKNEFFYSEGQYQPLKILKSKIHLVVYW